MLNRTIFSFLAQVLPTFEPHHQIYHVHGMTMRGAGRGEAVRGAGFRVNPQRRGAVGMEGAVEHVVVVRPMAIEGEDVQDRELGFEGREGHFSLDK